MSRPRAAVDSGSNSTRLLVVDAGGREVVRETRITRLGQDVDATGRLDADAIARTVAVIVDYRAQWEGAGVAPADVRIVATAAVRDAVNRDDYLAAVHETTGIRAEVATGDEEARLSFVGALGRVDVATPSLLVDIGGGSTELVLGDADGVRAAHSMQVGAVRVTERHLASDPPTAEDVAAARTMVRTALDGAVDALAGQGGDLATARSLVGVAGTVATVGALHAGADGPDAAEVHGVRVAAADVAGWAQRLLAMTTAERAALPGVPEGRADVVHAGALILDEVVRRARVDAVVVSLADNLDGMVASLA
jgi:exopolyphosphatase / guanosine-5'-triphosphate,3'-diphosphate pyrophosphatase